MKIALVGFGKMGHEIENLINESGKDEVVSISLKEIGESLDIEGIKKADVVIDFTAADVVLDNIKKVSALKKNMVIGTTGWYDDVAIVKDIVKKAGVGLIYGSNFSIGANIFFKILALTSQLTSKFGSYDVAGFEIHHTGKKDSPSGTAKKISSVILENFPAKKKVETSRLDRQVEKDELHFASLRMGRFFGYHEVIFDSSADEIKLSHNAHSRRGFAQGALVAAKFIKGKKGVYTFDEII